MDDGDINSAKMQVQGQMAAQYIQEVMQVCTADWSLGARPDVAVG